MFKGLTWIIVIIVLQAVVAALAKKAQANAQAAQQGRPAPPPPARMQASAPTSPFGVAPPQGKQQAAGRAMRPPKPPRARGYIVDAIGDSSDALQSRKHLAEQVAKVKAAEARIAQASGIKADHAAMTRSTVRSPALGAAELRRALCNPADIRKALILGEILGRPRGA